MKQTTFAFLLLMLASLTSAAQAVKITGKVTGEDGEPLAGVSVVIKGTKTGTATNELGIFSLSPQELKGAIVFSSIGFVTKEVALGKSTVYNTSLTQDPQALKQVVVVGYGTVQRKDLTGSVGSVNVADLQKAPVKSFDEALAGRVAGVQVTSSEGRPGAAIDIVIRGGNSVTQNNSPLYVIDGFPMENPGGDNESNPINSLDPADIESIDILKDASATAIYGARGANGVIVITTKRGKAGKTTINYNTYFGWQESNKRLGVLDPYEFIKLQNDIDPIMTMTLYRIRNENGVKDTLPLEYYKNVEGINWEDQIMQTAPMQSHHLSLGGGNDKTKFNASFSYFDQQGIIINSGFKRLQGRLSLDHNVSNKLKVGMNAAYANVKRYGTPTSSSNYNNELNLLFSVWAYRPITLLNSTTNLIEEGTDPEVEPGFDFRWNPVITTKNELRENYNDNFSINAYGEYAILPGLKFRSSIGYNKSATRVDVFNNGLSRSGNPTTNNRINGGMSYINSSSWLNENTLTWNKKINQHQSLSVLGGFTMQEGSSSLFGAYAKLLPNEGLGLSGLDEGVPLSISSTSSAWSLASFLGRVNYNIKSKYLFTASFRTDGSSRFSNGNRWGSFPSGAFAWRFGAEPFMQSLRFVSDAKLRTSWGVTGNNNVGNFSNYMNYITPTNGGYSFGNIQSPGSYPGSMGNPDLKWERTAQTDIGLDLGFFNDRLKLAVDVYRKNTSNLLLNASLPGSTGYSTQFKNIGKVRNQGLEISLFANVVKGHDFNWNSSFNISFNRNKVLELAENELSMLTTQYWGDDWVLIPAYIAKVGAPVAQFYGHVSDGVYKYSDFDKVGGNYILKDNVTANGEVRTQVQPGDIKYKDLNGDLLIDDYDKTVIGNPLPVHTGGFSNNFEYKGFDLGIFFQWSYGNDIYNANRLMLETGYKYNTNQYASYANHWSPENPESNIPRVKGTTLKTYATWMVEDGSFLRLKTVQLGYNLPQNILKRAKINAIRVYASAQNLYTWTKYSGYDPEVSIRNSALTPGFDYSAYPRPKTATVGLNVTF
ncbi:SusC/RagA family TonB-linked outer membrane protein [Chitinophaga sp. GCM10012297]|uniref:TonB-dependent receptor n=1 Tax=Chitinophaga chungangae TaxID=2821488 RepID=A0ABS3YCF1_9BACT|nr:TonB-dependent receptor [Chitinophaga chungangae]MBO9152358.1 TonB-dependent receptor [Chitinophaga chungangae]